MTGYCFDTDVLSATIRPAPPLHLIRRLATVPPQEQFTTSITVGELIYGARRVGREDLSRRVEQVVHRAQTVLAFDTTAARTLGVLTRISAQLIGRNVAGDGEFGCGAWMVLTWGDVDGARGPSSGGEW